MIEWETKAPTVFESLCVSLSSQSHVIMFGEPYFFLRSGHPFWESVLDTEIEDASWDHIHLFIHKGYLNVNMQENGNKIKTRWYKTLEMLHRIFLMVSDQCWRCEKEIGTFLDIWWTCSLIQPYWSKVHEVTTAISSLPLEFSPAQ